MAEKRVRIGVIGAGYWGPNLIRTFSQNRHSEVVAVCDLDTGRLEHAKNLYPWISVTSEYQKVTRSPEIDAVCVATPVPWHYQMAKDALTHGKHLLVEKPLTADVAQGRELVRIAEESGRILLVGHTYLYSHAVRKMKEIVTSGELGAIHYVNMRRLNLGLLQRDINVIWDLAPHDISILNHVLSCQPEAVAAQGIANILPGVEDVGMLILYYPGNIVAFVHVSWLDPSKVRKATFVGSRKMLVYDDVEPLEKIRVYDKGVNGPKHYDTFGEFQFSYRYGDIHTPYLENGEPLQEECRHFLSCIAGSEDPRSPGIDGLRVVQILEAAERSLKNGGLRERVA